MCFNVMWMKHEFYIITQNFCCLRVCYVFSMLCEWNMSSTSSSKTFVVFEYVMCFNVMWMKHKFYIII
jgi:hypothetical protein